MLKPFSTVDGIGIFAERRRYSNCTFTWLYAKVGNEFKPLGDPWPCVTPKRSEVESAAKTLFGSLQPSALPPVAARDIAAIRGLLALPALDSGRTLTDGELSEFRAQLRAWIREAKTARDKA